MRMFNHHTLRHYQQEMYQQEIYQQEIYQRLRRIYVHENKDHI